MIGNKKICVRKFQKKDWKFKDWFEIKKRKKLVLMKGWKFGVNILIVFLFVWYFLNKYQMYYYSIVRRIFMEETKNLSL